MQTYGYIRVSTKEQHGDRQYFALKETGVEVKNIFTDTLSGKDFKRVQYKRLLKKLKPGDRLVVKSIDRLGRNYEEIIEQWQKITKELRAEIIVLDMPLLDTTNRRDLLGTVISDAFCRFYPLWRKTSARPCYCGRQRGSTRQKSAALSLADPKYANRRNSRA